jgi:subtilisin-like proprotein convertase family protein
MMTQELISLHATSLQTVVPFQALAAFNGENPQGDWTFRIRDAYETDAGMLNSASIFARKIIPWLNPILN